MGYPSAYHDRIVFAASGGRRAGGGQIKDAPPHVMSELAELVNRGALAAAVTRATELSRVFPKSYMLWNILGVLRMQTGDAKGAALALRHATAIAPDLPEGQVNYAGVLRHLGRFEEAKACYRRALDARGDFGEAWKGLGETYRQKGAMMRAADALEQAATYLPEDPEVHHLLGVTQKNLGRVSRAEHSLRHAFKLAPNNAAILVAIGNALEGAGAFAAAEAEYRHAIALDPDCAEAYRLLSGVKRFRVEDPDIQSMLELYERVDAASEARCQICFALAAAYEETGAFARAFGFLREGNALRKARLGYDISYDEREFARLRAGARGLLNAGAKIAAEEQAPVPIFIVGMPRSGTTLVEQILSSHSDVTGAGELP
ncbi:tetratricopeptide repeat protein, partial [Thioclava sp. BHET1]